MYCLLLLSSTIISPGQHQYSSLRWRGSFSKSHASGTVASAVPGGPAASAVAPVPAFLQFF
jgi:hypothetical protein